MSTGVRIDRCIAEAIAARCMGRWAMREGCAVVGSIRRRRPHVGDIEIIAPMPVSDGVRPPHDALHTTIAESCAGEGLFNVDAETPVGTAIKGLKPMFRYCAIDVFADDHPEGGIKVEIHRYDPGPGGNRGLIELIRTGPAEHGQRILAEYARMRGGTCPAAEGGYLLAIDGARVPTPSEDDVYRLVGMAWVHPETRT